MKKESSIRRLSSSRSTQVKLYYLDINFDSLRKKSIKNEFQLAKDLLKIQLAEEEMDTENTEEGPEETAKNTIYNQSVGKLKSDYDEDDDDSDA
jgi:hypothetical protein